MATLLHKTFLVWFGDIDFKNQFISHHDIVFCLRVIHLTKSKWPNEYDQTMTMTNLPYFLNLTKIETDKPYETDKP